MNHTPSTDPNYWERMEAINKGETFSDGSRWDAEFPDLVPKVVEKLSWEKTKIDIYSPPPIQPVAIDIAEEYNGTVPYGSYGDMSCIYGPPKNKKSYFKSAIVAAYIGGKADNYFDNVKGRDTDGKVVFDIDTEQGYNHAWRSTHRVKEMCGFDSNPNYIPLHWREYTPVERRELLDSVFKDERYKGRFGLIAIDGVADFVDDVNDLKGTNDLIQILLSGSSATGAHIVLVMHCNYGTKKPTGHLGSAILKKCETIAYVENKTERVDGKVVAIDKSEVTVECMDSRNAPFDSFSFVLDESKLPKLKGMEMPF